jgi:Ca-activated chloride channel family protein
LVGPATRIGWRRHVPAATLLTGLAVLMLALSRPEVSLSLPRRSGTVIVAIDVSNSMAADDVKPTRLDAARSGALTLIEKLPSNVEIGVVAFGDGAQVVAQPSGDREAAIEAIERLRVSGGTSTGAGLYAALEEIAGEPLSLVDNSAESAATSTEEVDASAVDIGYFGASEVVMFSDGEDTSEIDPLEVADVVAAAGVKVTTVAVGTATGDVIEIDGYSVSTALDSDQLDGIAAATNGHFYEAADAEAFNAIADGLELEWRTEGERSEVTGLLAAIAASLLIASAGLAAWLLGRVI